MHSNYSRLFLRLISLICAVDHSVQLNVAVIGEGVVGSAAALALMERDGNINMTIFHHIPFNRSVSCCPAGLFRVDRLQHRHYGKLSFARYAKIFRQYPARVTGVNLLSGTILSTNLTELVEQERIYGDIVYNFRYLREKEVAQMFERQKEDGHIFGIHFTSYTTEGSKFVPWMKRQLLDKGVRYIQRRLMSLTELFDGFDVIINCAGLNGGELADDGDHRNMFPIRGVLFEIDAAWNKHFLYKRFSTFSIPTTDRLFIGSVKQAGRADLAITPEDRHDVLRRYFELQPSVKDAEILNEWSGLRPGRIGGIRLEMMRIRYPSSWSYGSPKKIITIVHNYGHGGHGFTLACGCGDVVSDLVLDGQSRSHFDDIYQQDD